MLGKGLLLLVVLSAAMLAAPAGAFAQSAGDDQYADPFGPVEEQGGSGNDNSGSEAPPPVQGTDQGSPEDLEPMQELPSADTAQPGVGSVDPTLPRTGFEAWLLLAMGWWMVLGGVALRRICAA